MLITRPWLLTFLLVALLTVRVDGAHWHLCLDGSEPPASLHMADGDFHHAETDSEAPHQDVDLFLIEDAVAKLGKMNLDLPVLLLVTAQLWYLLQIPRLPAPRYLLSFTADFPRNLRPPLRGPPPFSP